jgi:hypothetical protein
MDPPGLGRPSSSLLGYENPAIHLPLDETQSPCLRRRDIHFYLLIHNQPVIIIHMYSQPKFTGSYMYQIM